MCSSGTSIRAAARARLPAPSALTACASSGFDSAPSTSVQAAQLTTASSDPGSPCRRSSNASTAAGSVMSISGKSTGTRAGPDPGARVHLRGDQLARQSLHEGVQDQPIGLEHVLQAPRVLPPAAYDVRLDALAGVDEVLDRVGDLELSARRRRDRARG